MQSNMHQELQPMEVNLSFDQERDMKVAEKIIQELNRYGAAEKVRQVVMFIGLERAEGFFQQTLQIESSGGMMTLKGDRRRTPGGVFLR